MTEQLLHSPSSEPPAASASTPESSIALRTTTGRDARERLKALRDTFGPAEHPARDLRWPLVLDEALRQRPCLIEAEQCGRSVGYLPLANLSSFLFGRHLIGLPYVNSGGVVADDDGVAGLLIGRAMDLANELDCRFLELRHERAWRHPGFNFERTEKVHMRLALPTTTGELWEGFKSKVRSQIRKGQRQGFTVEWGGAELLDDFYDIFSRRMHELGTPVYSRKLFELILHHFGGEAELCRVRGGGRSIGAALLIHGRSVTEVPSAATLTKYNSTNVNMLMYWHLLERAVERGQACFDFGRASRDGNTFRFKKQWGAEPVPALWQYYVRRGDANALRPEKAGNRRLIDLWKRLPLWLTRRVGPVVVRGIP